MHRLLARRDGVARAEELIALGSRRALQWAVARGEVHRVLPGVYATPREEWTTRATLLAALAWAGADAAASHLTALELYGLPVPRARGRAHVAHIEVPRDSALRSRGGVVVHRPVRPAPALRRLGDVPCVPLERAVLGSWHVLSGPDRRAPVIEGVRRRLLTTDRLRAELTRHPYLRGRAGLVDLLALIDDGCDSELELWGKRHVFTGPGFEGLRWRHRVEAAGRVFRLDAFDEPSRTGIELDGLAYHSTAEQKSRDDERSRRLAEAGILVIRFSYRNLHADPATCRAAALRVMARRRADLA